jgi:AcrR family transcriptional regulator
MRQQTVVGDTGGLARVLEIGRMGEARTLRERRRRQTVEEIADVAFALFAERGYEATSVEQIAGLAGVSTRTFFRYFPSKEAVVFFDHPEAVQRLREALATTDASLPPVERVQRAMRASLRPGGDDARRRRQTDVAAAVPAVRAHHARLVEDFEAVVAEALAPSLGTGLDGLLQGKLIAGAIFGALRAAQRAAHADPGVDQEGLFEAVFRVLQGVGAPSALGPAGSALARRDPPEDAEYGAGG